MTNGDDAGARRRREDTGAERRERWFDDGAGVGWRVYERRRPGLGPALVFESAAAVRVVRDYPENWDTLPPRALEALSWGV